MEIIFTQLLHYKQEVTKDQLVKWSKLHLIVRLQICVECYNRIPGPLSPELVVPIRVACMGQVEQL